MIIESSVNGQNGPHGPCRRKGTIEGYVGHKALPEMDLLMLEGGTEE